MNWVTWYNKEQAALTMVITPKSKGRPRKDGQPPHQSEAAELKRLRMENQLLQDFSAVCRKAVRPGLKYEVIRLHKRI